MLLPKDLAKSSTVVAHAEMLGLTPEEFVAKLEGAFWAKNKDDLHSLAGCDCCCHEHTFPNCLARLWGGCRSARAYGDDRPTDQDDVEGWAAHYGVSLEEFTNEA